MIKLIINPSIWAGLLTLIILEIVLSIDNLVFIAILTEKLPPKKRDNARVIGLLLALITRLGLLSVISWIATLKKPILNVKYFSFSGRNIILLCGGIFLLFKATTELYKRLKNKKYDNNIDPNYASFSSIIVQIVVLDAVFSLDAVITAVGTVNDLLIMMIAVVIAMIIMLISSRSLIQFINNYQTSVILCLSFLLMIGLSLIAEGFSFYIPKGYLYTAIVFSIIIEIFNQIAKNNFIKNESTKTIYNKYPTKKILPLIKECNKNTKKNNNSLQKFKKINLPNKEHHIIGIISLNSKNLHSIMTPRNKITWLDCKCSTEEIYIKLIKNPYNMFPVCNGELDQLIGIVRAKDLMIAVSKGEKIQACAANNVAIIVPETLDILNLLYELKRAQGNIVMVSNKLGIILGLITSLDILKAITTSEEVIKKNNI